MFEGVGMISIRFGPLVVAFLALLCAAQDQHPSPFAEAGHTFRTLASFNGPDGSVPFDPLTQGTDGNFYGTTYEGGAGPYCNLRGGCGAVFKITPSGGLTTLYNFCSQPNCADGVNPLGGLVQATNGNFYGTTYGANGNNGTVFKLTLAGELTTLYSFCPNGGDCSDGADPIAGLVQAAGGDLYGTTQSGGAYFGGTVFKITPLGKLTTLHSFGNNGDGLQPMGVLVQASDGDFYGTTSNGGVGDNCSNYNNNDCGTVFKITPAGKLTTLYAFCRQINCSDGTSPQAGVIQASDGNFYGTTSGGGTENQGTIFRITPSGEFTTLYSFCIQENCADGYEPVAALIQATDGNLYGTTYGGGASGLGTVFRLSAHGDFTTLHSFDAMDGGSLYGGLIQGTNGPFYGTTGVGGTGSDGSVFGLAVGLRSFVETRPTSGEVAERVTILGTNLNGATSVTFNGTEAKFKIASGSEIVTDVPAGATTGKVRVKTPARTLVSNLVFRVKK
jgi:uncharacterized repeat protein (TIGR03803 family)